MTGSFFFPDFLRPTEASFVSRDDKTMNARIELPMPSPKSDVMSVPVPILCCSRYSLADSPPRIVAFIVGVAERSAQLVVKFAELSRGALCPAAPQSSNACVLK